MAVWGILRRGTDGFAFTGDMQVNFFRAKRDPDICAMRSRNTVIQVNLAKARAVDGSLIGLVQRQRALKYVYRTYKIRHEPVGGIFVQI